MNLTNAVCTVCCYRDAGPIAYASFPTVTAYLEATRPICHLVQTRCHAFSIPARTEAYQRGTQVLIFEYEHHATQANSRENTHCKKKKVQAGVDGVACGIPWYL
eukprot:2908312-Rhodomonas_salina.1